MSVYLEQHRLIQADWQSEYPEILMPQNLSSTQPGSPG